MSIGHVVQAKAGLKHPERLYIKLKNKSVYVYNYKMSEQQRDDFYQSMADQNHAVTVHLKHWKKVS